MRSNALGLRVGSVTLFSLHLCYSSRMSVLWAIATHINITNRMPQMRVYISYPNQKITIHRDNNCRAVRQQHKVNPRIVHVTSQTIEHVLSDFTGGKVYKFASIKALNDVWLDIALRTSEEEESFVHAIKTLLSRHYSRFEPVVIHEHKHCS